MRFESRVVIRGGRPLGASSDPIKPPTTPRAVALGHLAAHVDDLSVTNNLPEDSANAERVEFLDGRRPGVCRCRRLACFRRLLFVIHSASQTSGSRARHHTPAYGATAVAS